MKVLSVYLHIFFCKHPPKNYFSVISHIPPGSLESTPNLSHSIEKVTNRSLGDNAHNRSMGCTDNGKGNQYQPKHKVHKEFKKSNTAKLVII